MTGMSEESVISSWGRLAEGGGGGAGSLGGGGGLPRGPLGGGGLVSRDDVLLPLGFKLE